MPLSLHKIRTSVAFHEKSGSEKMSEPMASIRSYWGTFSIVHASWDEAAAVVPRRGSVAVFHHLRTEVANRTI